MSRARHGCLFTLSAPAGTGKDTVIRELKARGCPVAFPITYTTRPQRDNEVPDVHYHFVTPDEFARLDRAGAFLETAVYDGNWYGSPREEVRHLLESGRDVLLKIEVQGARQVKRQFPDAVSIFLMPPSLDAARHRMQQRDTESSAGQQRRLAIGRNEVAAADEFDHIVVNHDGRLDDVVAAVEGIIAAACAPTSVRRRDRAEEDDPIR